MLYWIVLNNIAACANDVNVLNEYRSAVNKSVKWAEYVAGMVDMSNCYATSVEN
jgi:hypothetical protein